MPILEAYDYKKNDFVLPSAIADVPTRYKVAYIFGTLRDKLTMRLDEMEGPALFIDYIIYRGFTYDDKVKWELMFNLKELAPSKTKINIVNRTEVEKGGLQHVPGQGSVLPGRPREEGTPRSVHQGLH